MCSKIQKNPTVRYVHWAQLPAPHPPLAKLLYFQGNFGENLEISYGFV